LRIQASPRKAAHAIRSHAYLGSDR
jgi:hypothetical protein